MNSVPLVAGFCVATAKPNIYNLCSELLDLREISTSVHFGDHLSDAAEVGCKSSRGEN